PPCEGGEYASFAWPSFCARGGVQSVRPICIDLFRTNLPFEEHIGTMGGRYAVPGVLAPSSNNCQRHDFEIEKQGPVADVIQIMAQLLFQAGKSPPAVNLRVPCNAASDVVARIV